MEGRESRERRREALLEQVLRTPETIEQLSDAEREELLEILDPQIIEQGVEWDPVIRDARKKLAQDLRLAIGEKKKYAGDDLVIVDEYMVQVDGERRALRTTVSQCRDIFATAQLRHDFPGVYDVSPTGYLILVTDQQKQFWVNAKLFHVRGTTSEELHKLGTHNESWNVLYVTDRYVTQALRGNGIGTQLSSITEDIARANDCLWVYGRQVPEDPGDLQRLVKSKRSAGYIVEERNGIVIAKKQLKIIGEDNS